MRTLARVLTIATLIIGSAGAALLLSHAVRAAGTASPELAAEAAQGAAAGIQTRPVLNLPAGWVAFSAKVRVFSPDMPRVEGRFYRSSDGSSRLETGPPGEAPRTIDIKNIGNQMHYLLLSPRRNQTAVWTSAPMDVPEFGGLRPVRRFADQPGLRKYPYRLSFRRGETPSVFATEGFEVYHYVDAGGNVHLQTPELNMLDLVNQSITGRREEIYDIVLEEPDPSLFAPPPGVPVIHQLEQRGMKLIPRDQHQPHR